jgi:predicted ATP-grasp superfamily ATP-dependent carboligase
MSFRLEKEKTKTSPYVLIDEDKCYMKLEGKSYLENITEFFKDINEWLENYLSSDCSELTFDCAMEYFNSSTTKIIYNLLRRMDRAAGEGANIVVNWIAAEDDEMIIECGEDFEEEMEHLTFNIVTV